MNETCRRVQAVLADPGVSSHSDLVTSHAHAKRCPACAGMIEDGIASRPRPIAPLVPIWLRVTLAILSVAQFSISIPWLLGYNPIGGLGDSIDVAHLTRDGALGLATSVAGLLTAWRLRYAVPSAAVAIAALLAQLAMALIDDHFHRVTIAFEGVHLMTVAVTALVAMHVHHSSVRSDRASQDPEDREDEPLRLV